MFDNPFLWSAELRVPEDLLKNPMCIVHARLCLEALKYGASPPSRNPHAQGSSSHIGSVVPQRVIMVILVFAGGSFQATGSPVRNPAA